ncbi:sulfotransferase domain-containing protein [Parvibaculum sp.]|uniref:sulfotransferase domain-containing protein n=1 Tax=Parvibaculum sp. TaxID=2024848 RepID=UPI000C8D1C8C|nr:sulfotransferase domain-containing protein [Parvibaculum sp.]MAB12737.1 sulfotransferase [Parvibaculum sp.]
MGGLIWLASYPKSGNTWMRTFLHNFLMNAEKPVSLNELTRFCISEVTSTHYRRRIQKPWEKVTLQDVMKIRSAVQADFTFASPDSVFVKTHNYMGDWLGYPLVNLNVTAGAIYMVRNPLDVVLSARDHFARPIDETIEIMGSSEGGVAKTDSHVPERYNTWSENVRSWTEHPSPQLLVLRYEDMLEKPTEAFGSVVRFLGLNTPPERLERAIANSSFKTLKALEKEEGFNERPDHAESFFRKGQVGQWREELTEKQIRRIISDHREQMERFGYIPEDYA